MSPATPPRQTHRFAPLVALQRLWLLLAGALLLALGTPAWAQLSANASTWSDVSCWGGSNGRARAIPSGGTPPYTYSWAPGGSTDSTATGLPAGTYTVTVTDDAGAQDSGSVTITQPTQLTAGTPTFTHPIGSLPNGNASVNATGGTGPYFYSWAPSGGTSAMASGLVAGNYTVSIIDNNACMVTQDFTLTAQPPTVQGVTVPASGTYGHGQALNFRVHYNAPITVTGTPSIALQVGAASRYATYASGSGSTGLFFSYQVQSVDEDMDGVEVGGTLSLNGGTLTSGAAHADLVLNGVGGTSGVLVSPSPTITGVSSNVGPTAGGAPVTITGTHFSDVMWVTFGGASATNVTAVNPTTITATTPAHAAGLVNVVVATAGGFGMANAYTYVAAPTVTAVSPVLGPTGGTSVTITGTGFAAALPTGAVYFGATPATYTIDSDTQITATAPAGSAGTVDVRVTTAGGTSAASASDQFTYIPAPTVTGISPAAGPLSGTSVTITGSGFAFVPGSGAVTFGGTQATYTVSSDTAIVATAPAGSAGTVDVRVTTAGGASAVSAVDQFTYVAAPVAINSSTMVAHNSSNNTVTLGLSGGAPTHMTIVSAASHGTAVPAGATLTYTPTAGYAGPDSFTYTATNAGGTSSTAAVMITVIAPTLALAPASGAVTGGTKGVTYGGAGFTASGGMAPYTYSRSGGTLPQGLTLDSAGALSGRPTETGTFNFTVRAQDSSTGTGAPFSIGTAYSITIAASGNADLSGLGLSSGTLAPAFSAGVTAYTAAVDNATGSINLTPSVADGDATVTINGAAVSSGAAHAVALSVGGNTLTVVVTAGNGTTKTYTVAVTRAAPPVQTASGGGVTLNIANPAATCTLTLNQFTASASLPLAQKQALPSGKDFPFAAADFAADQCQAGSDLTVTLTYPAPVPQDAQLLKWDGTAWQAFTNFSINGNQVIYDIADNGALDTDNALGRFADPVILAAPLAASGTHAIPTLGAWALALLSALLGALGWRRALEQRRNG